MLSNPRVIALFAALSLLLTAVIPASIAEPTAVQSSPSSIEQGILGGLSIEVSNISEASVFSTIADLPPIVEVYTATWCENCVPAEEGMMSAIEESGVNTTVLAFHRAIAESEDPFGLEAADYRWEKRYGEASKQAVSVQRAPPTMVVKGEWMHAGSGGLEGEALSPIYGESLSRSPTRVGEGSSSLSWVSSDGVTGTVTWDLTAGGWLPEDTKSIIFAVEHSATFEEGSNGLGDYHEVVRDMIELTGNSGSIEYTLPEAWDGDDLSLVLVHEWQIELELFIDPEPSDDGFLGLPSVGILFSVTVLTVAALTRRNQQ